MIIKNISGYFLIAALILVTYLMYIVFKPFFAILFLAAVVVTISYPLYEWLVKKLWSREGLAAFCMCITIILVVIVPTIEFFVIFTDKSVEAYKEIQDQFVMDGFLNDFRLNQLNYALERLGVGQLTWENEKIQEYLLGMASKLNAFLISATSYVIKSTANFILSVILLLLTIYYMFKDGKKFLLKVMHLSPLSNKYDRALFDKFREMSISSILSAFTLAFIQGIVGYIGYLIAGVPAFFLAIGTAFAGLIPVVGATLIWLPVSLYLLLIGNYWSGIFLLAYGTLGISMVDNLIRPFLIKGRTKIHPLLIFFSVFGGITSLGFMGLFFGPLILAVFLTFMHIYEMEYRGLLEKD